MKDALRRRTELKIPGFVLVVRQICFGRVVLMGRRGKGHMRVNDGRVAMISLLVMRVLPAFMYMEKWSQKESYAEGTYCPSGEHTAHRPIVDEIESQSQTAGCPQCAEEEVNDDGKLAVGALHHNHLAVVRPDCFRDGLLQSSVTGSRIASPIQPTSRRGGAL